MHVLTVNIKPFESPYNPIPLAADLLELPVLPGPMAPPVPVGDSPLGRLEGERLEPTVRVVGFATADAEGTWFLPEGIAITLLDV
jgi:hypothetical protein